MDNRKRSRLGGIILAAGRSTRMGQSKALMQDHGESFLAAIYQKMLAAGLDPIRIISGPDYQDLMVAHPELQQFIIHNQNPDLGQLHSLRLGIMDMTDNLGGVMVTLVDHPFVKESTYLALRSEYASNRKSIIIPTFGGRRGHPVIFSEDTFDELMTIPLDKGAKPVVRADVTRVREVEVEDSGVLADLDTPEDLAKWKDES